VTTPDGLRGLSANEREILAALAAKVANSDGTVNQEELRALTALGKELGQNMSEIARGARATYPDPEAALGALGALDESKVVQIQDALAKVASADGSISSSEQAIIDAVGEVLRDKHGADWYRRLFQTWSDFVAAGSKRFSAIHDDRYFREPEQVSRMSLQRAIDEHDALLFRYRAKRQGMEHTIDGYIESGLPAELVKFATLTILS